MKIFISKSWNTLAEVSTSSQPLFHIKMRIRLAFWLYISEDIVARNAKKAESAARRISDSIVNFELALALNTACRSPFTGPWRLVVQRDLQIAHRPRFTCHRGIHRQLTLLELRRTSCDRYRTLDLSPPEMTARKTKWRTADSTIYGERACITLRSTRGARKWP